MQIRGIGFTKRQRPHPQQEKAAFSFHIGITPDGQRLPSLYRPAIITNPDTEGKAEMTNTAPTPTAAPQSEREQIDAARAAILPALKEEMRRDSPSLAPDILESLASMRATSLARQAVEQITPKPEPEKRQPAKILQFPLPFGEDTRAASNPLARCALFAPVKERQFFKGYIYVGTVNGVIIEFAGEQLNQDDHDALLQLVRMALHKEYGIDVEQAVNAVLAGLGRHNHQEQRTQLFEQISRLVRGTLRLTSPKGMRYEGHLLDDATTPEDQKVLPRLRRHLAYRLNPKFSFLYDSTAYTLFDWGLRLKIKGRGSELAKWLHLWIESNAEQYAHKVETIRQLCGSKDKTLFSFRQSLRRALDLLKDAGIITAWRIDESDLVHIERTPSPAQLAHIAKKARKPRAKRPAQG